MNPPKAKPVSARPPWLLALPAGLVAALALLPVAYLLIRTIGVGDQIKRLLFRERTLDVLLNSTLLTLAVTLSALVLGLVLAWLTVRTDLPGRRTWAVVTSLPLVIPSYVGAYALIAALGPNGMLQHLLTPFGVERLPSLYGFPGAWLALTLFTYPYVLLTARAGFRGIDPSLEEAARSLGKRPGQVFREVVFPQLRPALSAGALLAALYTLSDFGAVSMFQFKAFTQEIYTQYNGSFNRNTAAVLALLLLSMTFIILALESRTRGRAKFFRSGTGTARPPVLVQLGRWRYAAIAFCLLVAGVGVVLPVTVITYWLVQGFKQADVFQGILPLAWNSIMASGLAAFTALCAALPIVILAVRYPSRLTNGMERVAYIGHALPGIVVALSLAFFGAQYVPVFYQTLFMLVLAYVINFLPHATGSIRASLLQISPRLEDASMMLGRSRGQTLRLVLLPLLRPGLVSGFALVFLSGMKELPITLILGPTEFKTLATRIWSSTEEAFFAHAALPSLILLAFSAVFVWLVISHEERQFVAKPRVRRAA